MFKYVIVWKRMNFIGSWILMIGHQWVTLFKRIKCGQYEEGVTGEWDGGFYKPIMAPVSLSLSSICWSGCRILSSYSNAMYGCMWPYLSWWWSTKPLKLETSLNYMLSFIRVYVAMVSFHNNRTLAKTDKTLCRFHI